MNRLLPTYLIFLQLALNAQEGQLTFYRDIQPIIVENCSSCHQEGSYGPFELIDYKSVQRKGKFVAEVVESRYMPPWKADPSFSTFANERILSEAEIGAIRKWVSEGMKKGKRVKAPPIPPINEINEDPDLELSMKIAYEISEEGIEDFRFFHIPTNLEKDAFIKSIEFVPGNNQLVHHSRIMTDTSNSMSEIDGLSELDPRVKEFQEIPLYDEFLYGWVPGNLPIEYPHGTGKKLPAGTDLILNVHYAPSSIKKEDKSMVKLHLTNESNLKQIKTLAIRENDISNQPFIIPAGQKKTFYVSYTVQKDMYVISIQPHMHYLGYSFKALAAKPDGEAIPLIKIDDWDFNWQTTYLLEKPLQIPGGSVILITAEYDNTNFNPLNPNSPPIDVGYGWNSTDEMMNFILYYYE